MSKVVGELKVQLGTFKLDIELNIPVTETTALFGRSGSGKTTVLRWIAGFIKSPQSYLKINDEVWVDSRKNIFVPPHLRSVGYVFQENNLFPHLTVEKNLKYAIQRTPGSIDQSEYKLITGKLGVFDLLRKNPHELSGGERQRVALTRALLMKPQILLLDEPLSALDATSKNEIFPYLEDIKLHSPIPILFVSHSVSEVQRFADSIIEIKDGKLIDTRMPNGFQKQSLPVPTISVVGFSGSGKTTLIEKLIPAFKDKGLRVGVIKHDAHDFEIDHKGKDSYRFFHAGADGVVISSEQKMASVIATKKSEDIYNLIEKYFLKYDLVLTEGYKKSSLPKIIVTRDLLTQETLDLFSGELLAVATDRQQEIKLECPILDLNRPEQIKDFILKWKNQFVFNNNNNKRGGY